jgi:hypothetical protein
MYFRLSVYLHLMSQWESMDPSTSDAEALVEKMDSIYTQMDDKEKELVKKA